MSESVKITVREHAQARRMRLRVEPGHGLTVTVPRGLQSHYVDRFIKQKRDWINRAAEQMIEQGLNPNGEPPEIPAFIAFPIAGREYPVLEASGSGKLATMENAGRIILRGNSEDRGAVLKGLQTFAISKARETLLPRLRKMSEELGFEYDSARVGPYRSYWGCCTSKGRISLSVCVAFLPRDLAEHVLLHELCHTKHLNHSKTYRMLMAQYQPDWRPIEHRLRRARHHVPAWLRWVMNA